MSKSFRGMKAIFSRIVSALQRSAEEEEKILDEEEEFDGEGAELTEEQKAAERAKALGFGKGIDITTPAPGERPKLDPKILEIMKRLKMSQPEEEAVAPGAGEVAPAAPAEAAPAATPPADAGVASVVPAATEKPAATAPAKPQKPELPPHKIEKDTDLYNKLKPLITRFFELATKLYSELIPSYLDAMRHIKGIRDLVRTATYEMWTQIEAGEQKYQALFGSVHGQLKEALGGINDNLVKAEKAAEAAGAKIGKQKIVSIKTAPGMRYFVQQKKVPSTFWMSTLMDALAGDKGETLPEELKEVLLALGKDQGKLVEQAEMAYNPMVFVGMRDLDKEYQSAVEDLSKSLAKKGMTIGKILDKFVVSSNDVRLALAARSAQIALSLGGMRETEKKISSIVEDVSKQVSDLTGKFLKEWQAPTSAIVNKLVRHAADSDKTVEMWNEISKAISEMDIVEGEGDPKADAQLEALISDAEADFKPIPVPQSLMQASAAVTGHEFDNVANEIEAISGKVEPVMAQLENPSQEEAAGAPAESQEPGFFESTMESIKNIPETMRQMVQPPVGEEAFATASDKTSMERTAMEPLTPLQRKKKKEDYDARLQPKEVAEEEESERPFFESTPAEAPQLPAAEPATAPAAPGAEQPDLSGQEGEYFKEIQKRLDPVQQVAPAAAEEAVKGISEAIKEKWPHDFSQAVDAGNYKRALDALEKTTIAYTQILEERLKKDEAEAKASNAHEAISSTLEEMSSILRQIREIIATIKDDAIQSGDRIINFADELDMRVNRHVKKIIDSGVADSLVNPYVKNLANQLESLLGFVPGMAQSVVNELIEWGKKYFKGQPAEYSPSHRILPRQNIMTPETIEYIKDLVGPAFDPETMTKREWEVLERAQKGEFPTPAEMRGMSTQVSQILEKLLGEKKAKQSVESSILRTAEPEEAPKGLPDTEPEDPAMKSYDTLVDRVQEDAALAAAFRDQLNRLKDLLAKTNYEYMTQGQSAALQLERALSDPSQLIGLASQEGKMERAASDWAAHDKSKNKLEIIESEDGKKKLVIRKSLRNLVYKKMKNLMEGSFKQGEMVAIDLGHYIDTGVVRAYLGNSMYRIASVAKGAEIEVHERDIFRADK